MADEQKKLSENSRSALSVAAGAVFGMIIGALTGQWWWISIGAGMGVAIGAGLNEDKKS